MSHHLEQAAIRRVTSSPNVSLETSQHVFEGAEKRLKIDFVANPETIGALKTFRSISLKKWQSLLRLVNCQILSHHSDELFDSYVLSESSLFVYDHQVIIKTCGTTTLLEAVPKLLKFAKSLHLSVDFVTYSRKSFRFPDKQLSPHKKFEDEIEALNEWFEGEGYVMGSAKGEKYYLYLADTSKSNQITPSYRSSPPPSSSPSSDDHPRGEQTIEILMDDLDRNIMKYFKNDNISENITESDHEANIKLRSITGIDTIIPNSVIKDHIFSPCGYSMNGHLDNSYSTIHVTPEDGFSFVSYETNMVISDYTVLIEKVIERFKPNRFIISIYSDGKGNSLKDTAKAFDQSLFPYKVLCKSTYEFEGRGSFSCYQYVKIDQK